MKALIACEYSRIVSDAFSAKGWDVTSCDMLPADGPGKHYQGNVMDIINDGWDLMVAFPPCTYLTVAANRHVPNNPERWQKMVDALNFVYQLLNSKIEHIGLENPVGVISSFIRKPDQIIHPYYFGDNIPKKTCLWLKNLPPLKYSLSDNLFETKTAVEPEYIEYNSKKNKSGKSKYSVFGKMGKGSGHLRSKFHQGIANAMAEQWTEFITNK